MDVLARYEPLVEDPAAFRAACDRPLPAVTRVNTIKTTVEQVGSALDATGIDWSRRTWHNLLFALDTDTPGNTWPYFLGWLHGQEDVSAIPPLVLDPQPGERIWDTCAAPGSKTTQLAAQMDDTGLIVANDVNLGRLSALRANTDRLGVTAVGVTNQDARQFSMKPFAFDHFDGAVVDAPCSGEGTIRKQPTALDDWSESFLADIGRVQRDILRRAIQTTKPGGTVVYSTCTFAPEENEAVLDHVLDVEPCRLVPFDLPLESRPGITEWHGSTFRDEVGHARRIYPHLNDTGGFFCAKLKVGG